MEYEVCEATGKRCYSKTDAQTFVNAARKKHWNNQAKHIPKRAYRCKTCGHWHLTKEENVYDHGE